MRLPLFFHRWLQISLSVILAVLLFVIIHPEPEPYLVHKDFVENLRESRLKVLFFDLDFDGVDERIQFFYNADPGMIACQIIRADKRVENQINIESDGLSTTNIFPADLDGDNLCELYVFTTYQQCAVVYQVDPFDQSMANLSESIFLDSLKVLKGNPGIILSNILEKDVNQDGVNELIFGLAGSYKTYYPRKVYGVDVQARRKILESEPLGIVVEQLCQVDLNQDGHSEFFGVSGASANIEDPDLYEIDDHSTRLITFDQDLRILPKPIQVAGDLTRFKLTSDPGQNLHFITGSFVSRGPVGKDPFIFQTSRYDSIERIYPLDPDKYGFEIVLHEVMYHEARRFVAVSDLGFVGFFDQDINLLKEISFGQNISTFCLPIPATSEMPLLLGIRRLVDEKVSFFNSNGREMAVCDFSGYLDQYRKVGYTTFYNGGSYYATDMERVVYFHFSRNPYYIGRWLIVPVGFILIFLFTELIRWSQRKQIRRQQELVKKMKKLELAGIKNQLDPHFTFNALNVLSYLAKEKDDQGVDHFVQHFSKLLRRQVETSDKPYTTLFDEVRFVEHYVELQKLRFDVPIGYDLDVGPEVSMNLRIPKMMIHTHVENAIKHGLIPGGGGRIWVRIRRSGKQTVVEIENDGASISESNGKQNGSTGKGLAILDQLYDLFYQLYKVRIRQEIVELTKEPHPKRGFLVRITL